MALRVPRVLIDLNEMLEPDLFLLAKKDEVLDSSGQTIVLTAGKPVSVYMDDIDDQGQDDPLIAEGLAELNVSDETWAVAARWCLRIQPPGIRHQSEDV